MTYAFFLATLVLKAFTFSFLMVLKAFAFIKKDSFSLAHPAKLSAQNQYKKVLPDVDSYSVHYV